MPAGDFRLDYGGLGRYLGSEEMQKLVRDRAELVKAVAQATAPDYEPLGEGYKYEFEVKVEVTPTGRTKTPRAVATVFNTSDHALEVEFGAGATPRHRTLGRAIGAAE